MDDEITCQCPTYGAKGLGASWYKPEELKALEHPRGQCPGDYKMGLYLRGSEELWLCSCCFLLGDKLLSRLVLTPTY